MIASAISRGRSFLSDLSRSTPAFAAKSVITSLGFTSGGIHGVVASLSDREVVIKLDSDGKLRMKIDRSPVGRIVVEAKGRVDELSPPPASDGKGKRPAITHER